LKDVLYTVVGLTGQKNKKHTTLGASLAASSSILFEYSLNFPLEILNQQEFILPAKKRHLFINRCANVAGIT
jgi:hypothetical protein